MPDNRSVWNSRWDRQFKQVKNFEEYKASMGVIVRDLLKNLRNTINQISISNQKVIDVGGGYGAILNFLIDDSNEKHLIEISESAIKIAKETYGIENTHLIDLTESQFNRTNYFDIVLCNELLEHINPLKINILLCNIFLILKPGGKIVVSTPNIRSLTSFFLMLFGWSPLMYKMDITHICPFSPKELNIALEKSGFKKLKLFTTKCLLFKTEKTYFRFPFRLHLGEHIIGVWEKNR